MRKVTVPIDMSSEQKSILGMISKRQLIYLIVGGAIIYAYMEPVYNLGPNFMISIIMCLVAAIPVATITALLAFVKMSKHNLHLDHYLIIKMGYKNQIGVWRKGPK
ncbi:PrgI family protein [Bacillus alkalicellulosilyticus]|uniref:PrgI family protein n=1 Tax=Alkalihalobacterium alkalicellulosilyticum TaxID=1912214 RepID=UPI000996E185|nr:PrgI family protein [Bacillus alkalicellulosilyticus]